MPGLVTHDAELGMSRRISLMWPRPAGGADYRAVADDIGEGVRLDPVAGLVAEEPAGDSVSITVTVR